MNWLTEVLLNMNMEGPDLITESVDQVFYSKDLLTLNSKQRDPSNQNLFFPEKF